MVIQDFLFLDSTSGASSNELFVSPEAEAMTLHVETINGTPNIMVQGKVDVFGSYQTIGAVRLTDYSVVSNIIADGLYSIPVSGMQKLRIVNGASSGSVKAYGRVTGN